MAKVGFIKGTKFVIPIGETSETIFLKDTDCVRLSFDNGGEVICGQSQLILLDDGYCEAIDCYDGFVNGVRIDGVELCGKHDTYDVSIANEEHTYEILVNGLFVKVHNIPDMQVIDGAPRGKWTKYIPYKVRETKNVVITHHRQKKPPRVDQSNLVLLGGAFEKTGDYDEVIGGGSQEMGSANK